MTGFRRQNIDYKFIDDQEIRTKYHKTSGPFYSAELGYCIHLSDSFGVSLGYKIESTTPMVNGDTPYVSMATEVKRTALGVGSKGLTMKLEVFF